MEHALGLRVYMDCAGITSDRLGSTIDLDRYCKCHRFLYGHGLRNFIGFCGHGWGLSTGIKCHDNRDRALKLWHNNGLRKLHGFYFDYDRREFPSPHLHWSRGWVGS
jgi:hypothetical protein